MKNKKEKIARFGIATKGAVYCLMGGLATMTAFNLGGKKAGVIGSWNTCRANPSDKFF